MHVALALSRVKRFNHWPVKCFLKVVRRLRSSCRFSVFSARTHVVLNFMVLVQVPGTSCSSSGRQKSRKSCFFPLSLFETLGNLPWLDMRGKRVSFRLFPNVALSEFASREAWNHTLGHGFRKQSNKQTNKNLSLEVVDEAKFGRNLCFLLKKV